MNTQEAAAYANVSPETVRRHVGRGTLVPVRTVGQGYVFERAEVERWARETNLRPGKRARHQPY